jgi:hypothetical protein
MENNGPHLNSLGKAPNSAPSHLRSRLHTALRKLRSECYHTSPNRRQNKCVTHVRDDAGSENLKLSIREKSFHIVESCLPVRKFGRPPKSSLVLHQGEIIMSVRGLIFGCCASW